MITTNISTLQIHQLTQEQYDRELAAGRIDENAIYLTPEEEIGLPEIVDLLLELDMVSAVTDNELILTDENSDILLW